MHGGTLSIGGVRQVQIQRLTLINERSAVRCHLEDGLLRDLPHRLVEVLDVLRNAGNALNGAVPGDKLILKVVAPYALGNKVFQEMRVDDLNEEICDFIRNTREFMGVRNGFRCLTWKSPDSTRRLYTFEV